MEALSSETKKKDPSLAKFSTNLRVVSEACWEKGHNLMKTMFKNKEVGGSSCLTKGEPAFLW